MVDYDTKLGEWFKQVEKKAEELRARKAANAGQDQTPVAVPEPESAPEHVEASARVEEPAARQAEEVEQRETVSNVATAEMVGEPVEAPRDRDEPSVRLPGLFDEADNSPVEDFLSFLSRTEEKTRKVEEAEEPLDLEIPSDKSTLGLSEGTGEPRPIVPAKDPEPAAAAEIVIQASAPAPTPTDVKPVEVAPPSAPPSSAQIPKQRVERVEYTRFPQQLQNLLQSAQDEVAQNSYKAFKESRAGLIERLLDPPLTLEEAARILNVCPTTVRRYTNRGILKHFRTAGNQRRFKLSDVLAFMESQLGQVGPAADEAL
jgi:excisionase family DNA binding protein